jgi:hypothetical protein
MEGLMSSTTFTPPVQKSDEDSQKSERKVASAADFRNRIKDEDCFEAPVYVVLPKCGLGVLLRRPRPLAYTLLGAPLPGIPQESGEAGSGSDGQSGMSPEERARLAHWLAELWGKVFFQPKLSLTPDFSEIHPDWVPEEDQRFIWKWMRGEVNDSGESLGTFPASVQG